MRLKKYLKQQKELNRRSFLVGAGTLIGLPFLESLHFSKLTHAQNQQSQLRVLFGLMDNGLFKHNSATRVHPEVMSIIDEVKNHRNVFYNLNNSFKAPDKVIHYSSAGCFATGVENRERNYGNASSFDQQAKVFTSSGSKRSSISILTANSYLTSPFTASILNGKIQSATFDIQKIYDSLIFDVGSIVGATPAKPDLLKLLKKGTLHHFVDSINEIKRKVSSEDKKVLENHLAQIDDLDRSLRDIRTDDIKNSCEKIDRPRTNSMHLGDRHKHLIDIIAMAFICQSTNVISLSLNDGRRGALNYHTFLPKFKPLYDKIKNASHGGDGGYGNPSHHQLSHFGNVASAAKISEAEVLAGAREIDKFRVRLFVDIAKKLQQVRDANGKTVLENSLIYFGGDLGDARTHKGNELPMFSIGSAGGRIQTNTVKNMSNKKLSSLHKSLLQALGSKIETFGDSGTGGVQVSDVAA